MARWVNKNSWNAVPSSAVVGKVNGRQQTGAQGNRVRPNAYSAVFGSGFNQTTPTLPNGAKQPRFDLVNTPVVSHFFLPSSPFPAARNKAWSKFIDNVRSGSASLGTAFAEMGESLEMIAGRASQLYRGYRHLRRGEFRSFLRTFGIGAKRKHRNMVRNPINQASSLWLEYSFGWSPLCKDIYDGVHALGQPVPGGSAFGKGHEDYTGHYRPYNGQGYDWDLIGRCRIGADVYISNPNTYLLQQLGLANPLQIAWELVPFSFVADWVFDVGSFLGGFTDLLGCTVFNPYTTYFTKGTYSETWYWDFAPTRRYPVSGEIVLIRRKASLDYPTPNVSFHANIGTSLKRAANAVSLLGQILTK